MLSAFKGALLPAWKFSGVRPVPGWKDYFVSMDGEVFSIKPTHNGPRLKQLKKVVGHGGYYYVGLCAKKVRRQRAIATLVMEAFVGPRPVVPGQRIEVRHLDGVRTNNHRRNLAWGTSQENADDAVRHGTVPFGDNHPARLHPERMARGSRHGMAKLTEEDVAAMRRMKKRGVQAATIATAYGITAGHVNDICAYRSWKHVVSE